MDPLNSNWQRKTTIPGIQPSEPAKEESRPDFIGQYKIESLLEKGGMSYVYLGTHPETHDPVTVKVLSPKYLSNEEVVKRFLKEAQIISLADHPNIIKLYDQGTWEEGLYIAMEFIEGMSLRQYLQQQPIPLKKALEIILEISYALCHLHTHGVIHRDLKLENVLMTQEGQVKVIDFGIAQLLAEAPKEGSSGKPRIIGTPIYMSPEQRASPETVSYPSDIYSLGIIAYELILGKLSHGRVYLSSIPIGLRKILSKCLMPNPRERYQDVVDLITDLSGYLNSSALVKNERKDPLKTLSELVHEAKSFLAPNRPPDWPFADVGLICHQGEGREWIYCDFLKFSKECYALALGKHAGRESDALLHTASLRGMTRALAPDFSNLKEFAQTLNNRLLGDPGKPVFSFSLLLFRPEERSLELLLSGSDTLWILEKERSTSEELTAENPSLGVEAAPHFTLFSRSWHEEERLLLLSGLKPPNGLRELFERSEAPGSRQAAEILYRELLREPDGPFKQEAFVLFHFQQKDMTLF